MDEEQRIKWLSDQAIALKEKHNKDGYGGQVKACKIIGVSRTTYNNWENGVDPAKVNGVLLAKLIYALGLKLGETMEMLYPGPKANESLRGVVYMSDRKIA